MTGTTLRRALAAAVRAHDAVLLARWRSGLQREARRQQDEFLALLLLDALGVESPTAFYTLELYPRVVDEAHRWHLRAGRERLADGFDGAACC